MKKDCASLFLALALCLSLAVPALAAEAPATAYTSDKLLWAGPIPLAGMTVIQDEYYLPLELLNQSGRVDSYLPLQFYESQDGGYHITVRPYYGSETLGVIKPVVYATPGLELGPAAPAAVSVTVSDQQSGSYQTATLPGGSIYTLAGHYPMVRLRALEAFCGYREAEDGVHICENMGQTPAVAWEEDLAGQAAKSLRTTNTRDTLQAFHDYLINHLTHEESMDNAYFQKSDPARHERYEQAAAKYRCQNNVTLAWHYGVCQNYAEIFQAMCLQNCTPCEIVTSYEMDHAWNRVWLWGEWYHVDVTFDDPGPKPTLRNTYFLVKPEIMMRSHCWPGSDFTMPETYDPAWEQIDPRSLATAAQYRKCLAAQLVQGKTSFSLRPATADAFGGSRGPVSWALAHYGVPSWSLRWTYKYNASTKSYDYTVIYNS